MQDETKKTNALTIKAIKTYCTEISLNASTPLYAAYGNN